tara:strand:+ start:209026 stop:209235 length:210 start_codon:yes stop_codon:yes gene_type:complete
METLKFNNPQLKRFFLEAKENEYHVSKTNISDNSITFILNHYSQTTFVYYDNKAARDEDFETYNNYSLT